MDDKQQRFVEDIVKYHAEYYGFILKKVHSHEVTDDILQNAYLNAWRSYDSLMSIESAKSWMYAIIINCVREYWRSLKRERLDFVDPIEDTRLNQDEDEEIESDGVLDIVIENFEGRLAIEVLEMLKPDEYLVMRMHYVEDYKVKEISILTGLKEKTVSSKLCRTRKKYRDLYMETLNGKGDGNNGK